MSEEPKRGSKSKKVGRPVKDMSRNQILRVRLREKEAALVEKIAKKNGFKTVSAFHRQVLLAAATSQEAMGSVEEIKPALRMLVYEVNSIGINLNQLTRSVNEGKIIDEGKLLETLTAVQQKNDAMQERLIKIFKGLPV